MSTVPVLTHCWLWSGCWSFFFSLCSLITAASDSAAFCATDPFVKSLIRPHDAEGTAESADAHSFTNVPIPDDVLTLPTCLPSLFDAQVLRLLPPLLEDLSVSSELEHVPRS